MLDRLDKTKRIPNTLKMLAEQVFQKNMVYGRQVALKAKSNYIRDFVERHKKSLNLGGMLKSFIKN